jgi:hypothetical protein
VGGEGGCFQPGRRAHAHHALHRRCYEAAQLGAAASRCDRDQVTGAQTKRQTDRRSSFIHSGRQAGWQASTRSSPRDSPFDRRLGEALAFTDNWMRRSVCLSLWQGRAPPGAPRRLQRRWRRRWQRAKRGQRAAKAAWWNPSTRRCFGCAAVPGREWRTSCWTSASAAASPSLSRCAQELRLAATLHLLRWQASCLDRAGVHTPPPPKGEGGGTSSGFWGARVVEPKAPSRTATCTR